MMVVVTVVVVLAVVMVVRIPAVGLLREVILTISHTALCKYWVLF